MTTVNVSGRQISQVAAVTTGEGLEIKNEAGNPLSTAVPARTPTTTRVASSATSVTILAENTSRKGLLIFNASTEILYLSFAATASSTNHFIALAANGQLLLDQQLIATNKITGIWAVANGGAQVTEFV